MNGIAAAFGATALYYVGFAVFRLAAVRMEPLRGNHIPRMVWVVLTNWIFLIGLALVLGGLALQIIAMGELALSVAIPIFMSGLLPLLLIAMAFFGERLTAREWLSLLLVGAAIALLVLSVRDAPLIDGTGAPAWRLMGTLLYGEPWPQDTAHSAMRLGALALAAIAVAQFPRHRPVAESGEPGSGVSEEAEREAEPPARDLFGEVPPSRDPLSRGSFGQAHLAAPHLSQTSPGVPPPRGPHANDPLGQGPDRPGDPETDASSKEDAQGRPSPDSGDPV